MKKLRLFDSLKFVRAIFVAVACMFILNVAHAATLPAGYTELEYLESTGTQYINTGIYPTDATETKVVGQYTELSGSIFGVLEKNAFNYYGFGVANGTEWRLWYGSGPAPWVLFGTADTNKHTFLLKNKSLYIDNLDTPVAVSTLSCNTQAQPMFLFGANFGGSLYGPSKARIFSVVIKTNNSPVRNFVPARRDSDGVLGMYDLADANPATAFYTNQGSGSFTTGTTQIKIATTKYNEESFAPVKTDLSVAVNAVEYVVSNTMTQAQAIDTIATTKQTRPDEGCPAKYCLLVEDEDGTPHWYPIAGANGVAHALPAGYTELQYIESTGKQWIDTGLTAGSNTRVLAQYKLMNTIFTWPISVRDTNSAGAGFGVGVNGSEQFISDYNGNRQTFTTITPNTTDIITVDKNKNVCTISIGGQSETVTNTASTFTTTNTLPLFAQNSNGSVSSGKYAFYSFKMWEGDTLVRDMVPAKYGNTVGMYDLADPNPSTAFHTNAGTGVFGEGPVVE